MLSVDTNVIVRYLTGDDPSQSARARQLVDGQDIFVCVTVLLETSWVLSKLYGSTAHQCVTALRAFAGLPGVTIEDAALVSQALDWTEQGMDLADALHLTRSSNCTEFITFDKKFVRAAKRQGFTNIRAP